MSATPGQSWQRLHPLSPVVRFGRLLVGVVIVLVPALEGGFGGTRHRGSGGLEVTVIVWAALVALGAIGGVINWAVTRWRIDGTDLQIETGVVRRQSLRIPLARVQAVDIVAPLLARMLGVAEVRVVSAGRGAERGRLAYVRAAEAPLIRARLLALAHGLEGGTPEPAAQPLARVSNARLALALPLRGAILANLLFILFTLVTLVAVPRFGVELLSTAFTAVFTAMVIVGRTLNDELEFSIAEAGDGLRLDRGLLQRRHETIPFGRIQAVRLVQPLLWRPFGWCRLEVDVARQVGVQQRREESQQFARTLLPVAPTAEVLWLLHRVFPEAGVWPPPNAAPPRRALLRAPFSYHFLAGWFGNRYVYARTGRVQAATVIIPLDKVQSVRFSRGPLQRFLGLASVHVDTAGRRWTASLLQRDQAEADALLWELSRLARLARRRTSPARGSPGLRPAMA